MKKWLAIVFVLAGFASAKAQSVYTNLFVENNLAETVSRIDLSENRIWNNVFTTGNVPNQIQVRGDSLYILNSVSSTLQIVDLNTGKEVNTIDLGAHKNPWNFTFCKSSGLIFVSNLMANSVSVVDLQKGTVVDSISVGTAPEGILAVGKKVYVTNTAFDAVTFSYGQGSVFVIDAPSRTVVDTILTPTNPQNLAVDSDGRLHVVCTGNFANLSGSVLVVDLSTNSVVDTVKIGGSPSTIAFGANGVAYLGAGGWGSHGNVLAYNAQTLAILHGADHPIQTGAGVMDVLADGEGHIFAAAFKEDRVDVIDTQVDSVVKSFAVGDGPGSLALWKTTVSRVVEHKAENKRPRQFVLEQNYPNPVCVRSAQGIRFSFQLSQEDNVVLSVYNVLGQKMLDLAAGKFSAGRHVIEANLGHFGSGLYFYRLKTSRGIQVRKLVVTP